MSSSPETSTRTTGAHRAHREARDRAAARTVAQGPPTRYEPYLDGLFTYCLSVLCDHDTATAALGDVLALAERRGHRGRETPDDRRAWLYALARWSCLRKLAEARQRPHGAHASGRPEGGAAGPHAAGQSAGARPAAHRTPPPVPDGFAGRAAVGTGDRAQGRTADRFGDRAAGRTGAPAGERVGERGSRPAGERGRDRGQDRAGDRGGASGGQPAGDRAAGLLDTAAEADRRRRELALLAWPEAAGTTPEQREALELAVRHQLTAHEVAAVLGTDPVAARELLAAGACEVERTRAALAVVETGTCPGVTRLTGDNRLVLSAALRRELVRHVDDCPRCRRTAERAGPGSWPGTSVTPAALPVLEAPRAALHKAMTRLPRARGAGPRFDRRGFPMDPKDHAARRDRLRARAVTTTVVATVVAAPVLALWAAYRGAPLIGEGADGRPVTANEGQDSEALGGEGPDYENAGNARNRTGSRFTPRSGSSDVSVEVVSVAPGQQGGLSVEASSDGGTTLITLTATGDSAVRWSARTAASWLYLSRSSGTLEPGESLTVKVYVDHLREPNGAWSARVAVGPAGAVVTISGYGTAGPTRPGPRPDPPAPSGPGPSDPGPGPGPSDPDPEPTPSVPSPSDPGPSEPEPEPTPSGPGPSDPEPEPPPGSPGGDEPTSGGTGEPSPAGS
ncbi:BACON domain-containing protein [Streptomyces sp. FR-108]|uniref:BACON domain-containing protein n=1 Tax=Streptomyces sp. FR-108 TaxID=3416665 RepID=UPI003CEE260A